MHNTGAFLPLIPVRAFGSGVDAGMQIVDDMQLPDGLGGCQDAWSARTGSARTGSARSDVAPLRSRLILSPAVELSMILGVLWVEMLNPWSNHGVAIVVKDLVREHVAERQPVLLTSSDH
ncbi:hypothetical protein IWX91DRAFT_102935 [Phyllosticta citricarpa]